VSPSNTISPSSETWEEYYESAVAESESSRMYDRIDEARTAIFDRAEEILTRSSNDERISMNNALRTLRLLEESAHRRRNAA